MNCFPIPPPFFRLPLRALGIAAVAWTLAGCGGDGGGGLKNKDPGPNDLHVVAAFGDSFTRGSECDCPSYPARLSPLIGKSVLNTGVSGSRAQDNVGRTREAIGKYHPGFMLILYGVNDIIMSSGVASTVASVHQMVTICKENQVVPVVATYPVPIGNHALFSFPTLLLNEGIRGIAQSEGIKCVDLEREFEADPLLYMGDGLHPNDAGTQVIALAFADLF